jgi:hypothetical protein
VGSKNSTCSPSPVIERLVAAQVASPLNRDQWARAASTDPGHLSRVLRGISKPSLELTRRLAAAVDAQDVLDALEPFLGQTA